MVTYEKYNELKGNTLKYGDNVILKGIPYRVEYSYLFNDIDNSQIFRKLKLEKREFCEKHYGYSAPNGNWPSAGHDDYKALTRVVLALFLLIEPKKTWREIVEAER